MKILLTNDDGYKAPNIQNLYKKLSENHDVWMIAPENNCSGMSAAISFLKETKIRQVEERIYAVDGTPADCTYFGLLGIVDFSANKTNSLYFFSRNKLLIFFSKLGTSIPE